MEKEVIISIRGTQTDQEGGNEVVEFVTHGSLTTVGENGYHVSYQESELTGLEGTTTTFCIDGDQVTMLRRGSLNSEMVFREGKRHISMYETSYGGFMIGVNTQKVRTHIGRNGGEMELQYSIDVENTVVGNNVFHIEVQIGRASCRERV